MTDKENVQSDAESPPGDAAANPARATEPRENRGRSNVKGAFGRARRAAAEARSDVRNIAGKAKQNSARR
jgi:hypothetical protein